MPPNTWTPLPIDEGGTGGTTKPSARKGLGLGWISFGTGVPSNSVGANGDFYFRSDGGAGTCIYQKRIGVWVATGA
jgi:hypothetical protein